MRNHLINRDLLLLQRIRLPRRQSRARIQKCVPQDPKHPRAQIGPFGKRCESLQGLGTRVLDEIISYIKGTEARRIWLYASEMGEPVYARAGFTIKTRRRPEMELIW